MSHPIKEWNLCLSSSDSWLTHWRWSYILPQDTTQRPMAKLSILIRHSNNSWGFIAFISNQIGHNYSPWLNLSITIYCHPLWMFPSSMQIKVTIPRYIYRWKTTHRSQRRTHLWQTWGWCTTIWERQSKTCNVNINYQQTKEGHQLSQIVTYYLWWVLWYFKEFKNAKLDKWQKMLLSLRSNSQTKSPYIQNCDSLCTRTDYHMLLPIVLYMVVPLCYE